MEDGNEGSASRPSIPLGHVQLGHWSPEERLLLLRPNLGKYHHAGWMPPQSRTFCRAKKVVTRTLRLAPLSAAAITIREAAQGERGPAPRGAWERHPVSIRALGTEHSHAHLVFVWCSGDWGRTGMSSGWQSPSMGPQPHLLEIGIGKPAFLTFPCSLSAGTKPAFSSQTWVTH